ncbi:hypothetical protein ACJRO7_025725 [Eucalyptus globulus]|uniref:H(+)-exporting diphosphatase n=1 Tax=Eucalyptus globulus TaxID=34317 RepID=A0ABD3KFA4_EUCGL
MALLSALATEITVPACAAVGMVFSLVQWFLVSRVKLTSEQRASPNGSDDRKNGFGDSLIDEEESINEHNVVSRCADIQSAILEGATSFLLTEYQYVGIFMIAFAILIFLFLGSFERFSTKNQPCTYDPSRMCKPAVGTAVFSTVSFLLGAFTSILSGFLGMKIATYANARMTLEARKGVGKAFITAFRSRAVMGFLLASNGLLVLFVAINLLKLYYGDDWGGLFEAITGYGLGGSSMALFGRVGGGIYTKAANVGADLVGKVERNIPEDDPRNPAVIADNVGDNVGDIAGMGSDLFGSYAESSCAAPVVASISSFGINHDFTAMCYPLLISSVGILVYLITTLFATNFFEIKSVKEIEPALKRQLIISTALMTVGIAIVTWIALPSSFMIFNFGEQKFVGLWTGLIIGFVTEYFSSNAYSPVQDVADSCRTGAATNVIFCLASGYKSVIIPIFAIAISTYVSFSFAAMYGIAVAALGVLSTIATGLAINAYGPISDNAGALLSLAPFGAFVSHAAISTVDVLTPKVFVDRGCDASLLVFCHDHEEYSSTPSLASRRAAKPDYATCIKISTDASIKEMIPPGALVIFTSLIVGTFFGVETLSVILLALLFLLSISASNTGGAWDNAKKYIEDSWSKGSEPHKAAVIGDTIGDLLKDTSGPSPNILIKLMAVESLVFAPFFATHGGVLLKISEVLLF